MQPTEPEIRSLAYLIWEKDGRPVGRDQQHWLEAERLLAASRQPMRAAAARSQAPRNRLAMSSKSRSAAPVFEAT